MAHELIQNARGLSILDTDYASMARTGVLDTLWPLLIVAGFICIFVTGGTSLPSDSALLLHGAVSLPLAILSLLRLWGSELNQKASFAVSIVVAALLLIILQVTPLPLTLWSQLPGRDLIYNTLDIATATDRWQPLSLDASQTLRSGLMFLSAVSLFLACLSLRHGQIWKVLVGVIALSLLCAFIGFLQIYAGKDSLLNFYNTPLGSAHGTFGNKNFFASQMMISLPLAAALLPILRDRFDLHVVPAALVASFVAGIFLAGLALTGSRAAIVLAIVSVVFSAVLVVSELRDQRSRFKTASITISVLMLAILVIGLSSTIGLLRLSENDPLADLRGTIYTVSLEAAQMFLPFGSGFGTFVPVYQLVERPEVMVDNYVNHAHNDLLQLVIEGGMPAAALAALFVAWFLYGSFKAWRGGASHIPLPEVKAFTLAGILLLLHSLVDFPLRNPALLSFLGLACGIVCVTKPVRRKAVKERPAAQPRFETGDPVARPAWPQKKPTPETPAN